MRIRNKIENEANTTKLIAMEKDSLCSLHNTMAREEQIWRKKSKVTWIQASDQNTQIFKLTTFKHRPANKIMEIKNEQGLRVNDQQKIKKAGISFYHQLLSLEIIPNEATTKEILSHIPKLITYEDNRRLTQPFSFQEIEKIIFSMAHNKSLRPDGFTTEFFQSF